MLGWFYTNKDGVVCRCALHEISPSTLFQKLVGSATLDEAYNPNGYVALSHFESGVSRPLKQAELQHLVRGGLTHVVPWLARAEPVGRVAWGARRVPARDVDRARAAHRAACSRRQQHQSDSGICWCSTAGLCRQCWRLFDFWRCCRRHARTSLCGPAGCSLPRVVLW